MPMYVAFLRAINLGAHRKFPKASIVEAAQAAGCTDVETYINTGNVRLRSSLRSRARLETALEQAFLADRGFEVPTIVFTPAELREIAATAAELAHPGRHYVSLLKQEPGPEAVAAIEARGSTQEVVKVRGRAVHLLASESYLELRIDNAVVERQLGVATNRNLTVVRTLAEKWG